MMPDFVPYQTRHERPAPREDGKIALSPERWQLLVAWFTEPKYLATSPGEIEVVEPVDVNGITFLPAVYLAA